MEIKFFKSYNLPKPDHKKIENLNRPFINKEIETVIKNFPNNKSLCRTRQLHW